MTSPFTIGQLTFTHVQGKVHFDEKIEGVKQATGLPELPEMYFGDATVTVSCQSELFPFTLSFDAESAIATVDNRVAKFDGVAAAATWQASKGRDAGSRVDLDRLRSNVQPFDWTYSTDLYTGKVTSPSGRAPRWHALSDADVNAPSIDWDLLRAPLPVRNHFSVILFEDELADNGTSIFTVRTRIHDDFSYILGSHFIRVDGLACRAIEHRIFIRHTPTPTVLRQTTIRQSTYAEIGAKLPSDPRQLADESVMIPLLQIRQQGLYQLRPGTEDDA